MMTGHASRRKGFRIAGMLLLFGILAGLVVWSGSVPRQVAGGDARLLSFQPFPEMDGEMCIFPASATMPLTAALQAGAEPPYPSDDVRTAAAKRPAVRAIQDPHPAFSAVALDLTNDEVVLQDENTFGINIYNRTDNTAPTASMTEPKRQIRGEDTFQEYNCSVYVDPKNGDLYSVNNDTLGILTIYDRSARGNAAPKRMLATGGLYGIAADEETGELFVTAQGGQIRVYRKEAQGRDRPIREIEGPKTQMADSHGMAIAPERGEIFVLNWGTGSKVGPVSGDGDSDGGFQEIPGSGYADYPSITAFPKGASGDVAPLRVIKGPKTQLNWPTQVAVSAEHGEIFVANDTGNSITVYPIEAQGDVAPIRVIKGPKSRISNPKGIAYDPKHDELFVANFSNHSATVYPRTAHGDVPPSRIIRSAPLETQAPMMGNPHTVVYNPVREEILVGQ